MPDNQLKTLEEVLKALADRTRLRILSLLSGGEVCVCHLHEALRISQPKASRHLAYLKRAGLVVGRKDGLWVHYRMAQPKDGVAGALLASVAHFLTHVASSATDRSRLEKITGCCQPAAKPAPAQLSCCDSEADTGCC
ncbi:MAG TPA: transcriptional regulator [Acidobacteria bacterium]|jgi:ArsR family transcriptional regulator|nr:transcriptional regulator [Acidobacteriota bacterium]MDP6372556.1 metalloregulator ArsR/SmtB family transcription factor [Vicinamibacterales bacterium]MDP6800073.1 metalloregulator ArsR/SmtB family transcription factor [SAR202 cluster bacterium]MBU22574.1 transcriptional regulator [Acidobacteriota bacterium]MDP7295303.1 metalloregulator ArsR/SmtB family transcription factor [Vicinamibacterales bacterium]|tara:strand:+ start:2103 stop:2516 length:414 start_codon:yes stop_codon:yes gene_type:complete